MSLSGLFPRRLVAVLLVGVGVGFSTAQAEETLRIGYQKSSTLISLLKTQGTLEQKLAQQGVKLSWHEFTSGQPLLEALNLGNVDLSADVADTVPIFAQAAGAKLTYFAQEAPSPKAQGILVHQDSALNTLADLKGKKVAVTKAAGSHYLLIAALTKAGLKFSDIQPAYLTPADGRAAFENRSVEAWVTWEPFLSSAERQLATRDLTTNQALAEYRRYYLTRTDFSKNHAPILEQVFNALVETGVWVRAHPKEAAQILSPLWGNLDPTVVEQANRRRSYQVGPVRQEYLNEQQKIADAFWAEGVLPKKVDAHDVHLWSPQSQH